MAQEYHALSFLTSPDDLQRQLHGHVPDAQSGRTDLTELPSTTISISANNKANKLGSKEVNNREASNRGVSNKAARPVVVASSRPAPVSVKLVAAELPIPQAIIHQSGMLVPFVSS